MRCALFVEKLDRFWEDVTISILPIDAIDVPVPWEHLSLIQMCAVPGTAYQESLP